ncbi:MAG: GAF domain-containing protein [Elusimicrobia bacterium]|nr:GAF domain-containing protein [Elusimicrobiota bacterium]
MTRRYPFGFHTNLLASIAVTSVAFLSSAACVFFRPAAGGWGLVWSAGFAVGMGGLAYAALWFVEKRGAEQKGESKENLAHLLSSTSQELTLTNLRLIKRVRELRALYDVASLAMAADRTDELVTRTLGHVLDLLDAGRAEFWLWDERQSAFLQHQAFPVQEGASQSPPSPMTQQVIEPWLARLSSGETIRMEKEDAASQLLCPLTGEGNLLGLLIVKGKKSGIFEDEDLRTLSLLSRHLSDFFWNMKLRVEKDQRLRDLTALQDVASVLSSEPGFSATIAKITHIAAKALEADICAFLLYDEKNHELVTQPGAYGLPKAERPEKPEEPHLYKVRVDDPITSSGRVFLTNEPFLSADGQNDYRVNPRTALLWGFRSLMVAPLNVENRCIGVLRVGHRKPNVFTQDHLRLATLIAEEASVIVQNARLYEQVQASVHELKRLNNVKTEFISMVSHELLTPLTTVKGFVSVILSKDAGSLTEQQEKFLTLVNQSVDRLVLLIDDLLDISRIESGRVKIQPASLKIDDLLRQAVADHSSMAEKNKIALESRFEDAIPAVIADPHRIRQVVDNLLTNAIKYTPKGGKVLLSARGSGEEIIVSIRDTGAGIPESERERIFEKFYRMKQTYAHSVRGTGLGLAICKSLVELHGGRIWVDSKLGQGSDFQFALPIQPRTETPESKSPKEVKSG